MVECAKSFLTRTCPSNLNHARATIASWIADYKEQRPHSQLGYLTPARYAAANLTAICDRLRNADQLRQLHVAPHAPHGVKSNRDSNRRWMKVHLAASLPYR
jgi:putative transposase